MIPSKAAFQCRTLSKIGPSAARVLGGSISGNSVLPSHTQSYLHMHRQHPHYSTTSTKHAPSTAQLVKQLREATGAPMMECKKALASPEVNNDIQLAQDWLRKHGSAKASSKVAGREALEGLVGIQLTGEGENQVASLVKVASETDFASRSMEFSTFVQDVANAAAAGSVEDEVSDIPHFLSNTTSASDGKPLSERLNDAILAIRENLQVDSISVLKASTTNSVLSGYVHGRASPNHTCGTAASLVDIEVKSDEGQDAATDAAKKLAMHVVAAKPLYLTPESVPEEVVEKEKEILLDKNSQGPNANKPPEILEKIINGQLRKYYEGVCLTEQAHMVEEGNPKVGKYLKKMGLEVKNFKLMGMGK